MTDSNIKKLVTQKLRGPLKRKGGEANQISEIWTDTKTFKLWKSIFWNIVENTGIVEVYNLETQ